MASWLAFLFFAPLALGATNTSRQVQPFVASLNSELRRLLPHEAALATPSDVDALPDNVTALLPKDVSNSTVLGLLSALGASSPNNFTSCVVGWLKSAPTSELAKIAIVGFTIFSPVWGFGVSEIFCGNDPVCTLFVSIIAMIGGNLVFDTVTVPLDATIGALLLCILNIEPGQVSLDSLKVFRQRAEHALSQVLATQLAHLGKLLQDGHGFEAGFTVGRALREAWLTSVVQQPLLVV